MPPPMQRPQPFTPGTPLSEHYLVEGLVRLAEGRMFYIANDDRADRPRRFCWECACDDTLRSETTCVSCGADLSPRRFLVAVRWDQAGFRPFADFFERRIDHPAFAAPVDMFFQDNVMCTVTPWNGEGVLVDEASPLSVERSLYIAQRMTGLLAFLHQKGVSLGRLNLAHFLVRTTQDEVEYFLFDPDIQRVQDGPVPEGMRGRELPWLAAMLRRLVPVGANKLRDFFSKGKDGIFPSPFEFGRAIEEMMEAEPIGPHSISAAMSDVGLIRSLNEDNWGWGQLSADVELHVVADGMGGHEAGEVASDMAVEIICREARRRLEQQPQVTPHALENVLEESFRSANNAIKDHSERMGSDMGTTMVATLLMGKQLAYVANVGDSRGYLMRGGVLHQVTRDHSLVARMVEQNRITKEDARHHPHSNILLRTVGTERDVDVDIFSVELSAGDRLLLCSDGLWGEVDDEDIEAILNAYEDPRQASRELVRAAHYAGARDNVTVLVITV